MTTSPVFWLFLLIYVFIFLAKMCKVVFSNDLTNYNYCFFINYYNNAIQNITDLMIFSGIQSTSRGIIILCILFSMKNSNIFLIQRARVERILSCYIMYEGHEYIQGVGCDKTKCYVLYTPCCVSKTSIFLRFRLEMILYLCNHNTFSGYILK